VSPSRPHHRRLRAGRQLELTGESATRATDAPVVALLWTGLNTTARGTRGSGRSWPLHRSGWRTDGTEAKNVAII
jgi:hypothetical protein